MKADNKQRYTLLEELGESAEAEKVWLIRANQGHSMKVCTDIVASLAVYHTSQGVRMELTPITSIEDIPTGVAVHGTTWGAWKSISESF